jgi:hypothetical protein
MEVLQSKVKTFTTLRQVVTVATVVFYIMYSAIKRFADNPEFFWIPFILVCANVLLLTELSRNLYVDRTLRTKSNITWLVIQAIINVGLAILIFSYI